MYNAEMLLGQEYFSSKKNTKNISSKNQFQEFWRNFTLLKTMAKDQRYDKLIKNNITKNKKIKSGTAIIKGTRISTQDIMHLLANDYDVDKILNNFPTIQNQEQIMAATAYEIRRWNFLSAISSYIRNCNKG